MDLFSVRRRKTSLCCLLNNEASYGYHLEDNLRLLETRWEKLQERKKDVEAACLEENIEETQRCHQVISGWLKRMESIEEQITDIQVRGNEQTKRKWLCGYFPRYGKSSYKLGKNVAKILRIVDELETEGEQFHGDFKIALKHLHKPNEMPCGETVGLDLMFEKVWRSIEETNIGIIGLYGMGGVGKTTLLKKVNNELAKRSGFYIVWVVVSKSPNLDSIMGDIREFIGIGDDIWNCCRNQDRKAREIYKVLKTKKFVLLLDDIWHRLDLEKVGVPHPKETNFQSKVLFTTRFEDVCAKMKAQREFKVEVLTEKEALELFCMKVGEETLKSSPVIRSIAQEMARDCKGLPLALSVVGSAMAGVKSVEAWQHSINNLAGSSWTFSGLETKVFFVLKFSYDQLPDETHKKCFLYCALYPEDYVILEHHLIFQWIGEGFLDIDGMRSVHDMYCRGQWEWFDRDAMSLLRMTQFTGTPPNVSIAYTINGQPGDLYRCSSQDTVRIPAEPSETILLRIINAALEQEPFLTVANHRLTVVSTGAAYTKPFTTSVIMIGPGQTVNVLLTADQAPSRYYMAARAYESAHNAPFDNTTTTAILEYMSASCKIVDNSQDQYCQFCQPLTIQQLQLHLMLDSGAFPRLRYLKKLMNLVCALSYRHTSQLGFGNGIPRREWSWTITVSSTTSTRSTKMLG
ncbi:hypothetical protein K1719_028113 [Acacia pycnantha]|nr:hypothetical protein K1719_028113 [Acacia pycnantha]